MQYHDGTAWKPVEATGAYGVEPDQFNRVAFKPVTAYSLRVVAQLRPDASAGLFAVRVYDGDLQLVPTVSDEAAKAMEAGASADTSLIPDHSYRAGKLKADGGAAVETWPDTSIGGSDGGESFAAGSALVQGGGGEGADDFGLSLNARGQVLAGTGNPSTSLASAAGLNDGKPHLAVFTRVKANGGLNLSVDGTVVGTASSTNFTSLSASDTLALGATPRGDAPFTGEIGEVAVISTPLSKADRERFEKRAMARWGIR